MFKNYLFGSVLTVEPASQDGQECPDYGASNRSRCSPTDSARRWVL